jgi:hypothetical protein
LDGYCEDFPVEQYYRDVRIHPIHEGTTGIQGLDLLGRKITRSQGRALSYLQEEIQQTIATAIQTEGLSAHGDAPSEALERLNAVGSSCFRPPLPLKVRPPPAGRPIDASIPASATPATISLHTNCLKQFP